MEAMHPSPHHDDLRRRKEAEYLAGYAYHSKLFSRSTKRSADHSSAISMQPSGGEDNFPTQSLAWAYSSIQNNPNDYFLTQSANFPVQSAAGTLDYTLPPMSYFPLESVASSLDIATASLPYFPLQTAPATAPSYIYATGLPPAQIVSPIATTLQAYTAPAQPMSSNSKPAEFLGVAPLKIVPTTTLFPFVTLLAFYFSLY